MPRRGARCGTTLRLILIYSWSHPTSLQTFMHARGKGGGGLRPTCVTANALLVYFCPQIRRNC